jgi:hypothetical protein
MVNIVRHDLEFILKQIKIAEAHSAGTPLTQIRVDAQGNITNDPNAPLAVSTPLSPYGLRSVDGSYNNLVEGRDQWGAADNPFPRITDLYYRNEGDDSIVFGAGSPGQVVFTNTDYAQSGAPLPGTGGLSGGTLVDADPRIISNLIVDQTLDNPAAIYAALTHAGMTGGELMNALNDIRAKKAAYDAAVKGGDQATVDTTKAALASVLSANGVEMDGESIVLRNVAPDEGLSASYNGWFTLFGQFFDHGLDLVPKGGNGTIYIPLQPDDPLYNPQSPHTNFMALTRAPTGAVNLTTPWVDQNQTYTSHSSHQLFLREYTLVDGKPVATGKLLEGDRGLATWADVKEQARTVLGVNLTDADVTNIPCSSWTSTASSFADRTGTRSLWFPSAPTASSAATTISSGREIPLTRSRPPTPFGRATPSSTTSPMRRCPSWRTAFFSRTAIRHWAMTMPMAPPGQSTAAARRPPMTTNCSTRTTSRAMVAATRTSASPPSTTCSTPSTTTWWTR